MRPRQDTTKVGSLGWRRRLLLSKNKRLSVTPLQHKLQGRAAEKVAARVLDAIPENAALPYPAFDLFWGWYRKENV